MEKRIPHCKLRRIRTLIDAGQVRATNSALRGAAAMDFDFQQMVGLVKGLTPVDFYKSMTAHADHTIWQDVYLPATSAGVVYLKLTVIDGVLIVSFKER